jgi:crossover junction endodeoxyribonuclease RuvC
VIVLGIDPGTANTGYGVVEGGGSGDVRAVAHVSLMECGVIRTRPRDPLATRLHDIYEGVVELIERHKPNVLCVEDVFYAKNVRTTVVLGHARGVVLLAGSRAKLDIREIPPAEIKKAIVGSGAATKEQVQFMLTRMLRLKSAPQPTDASDGVAAAIAGLVAARLPTARPAARRVEARA